MTVLTGYPVIVPKLPPSETWHLFLGAFHQNLTISGGWGYTQKDSVQILSGDIYETERTFIMQRNQQDLLISRCKPVDHSLVRIQWQRKCQALVKFEGRMYDRIIGTASGVPNKLVFDSMESLDDLSAEGPQGKDPGRLIVWEENRVFVEREFWFDITACLESSP